MFIFEVGQLAFIQNEELADGSGSDGNLAKINLLLVNHKSFCDCCCSNFNKVGLSRGIRVLFLLEIDRDEPSVVLGLAEVEELTAHLLDFLGHVEVFLHLYQLLFLFLLSEPLLFLESFLLCLEGLLLLFGQFLLLFGFFLAVLLGAVFLDFFWLLLHRNVLLLVLFTDLIQLSRRQLSIR